VNIIVNGETKEFKSDATLQSVIDALHVEEKVMAAAVNMQIVKKEQWACFELKEDDKLELLQFVGGG
jgi:sulfur carrier protein